MCSLLFISRICLYFLLFKFNAESKENGQGKNKEAFESELQMVQMIFRHGDRTPSPSEVLVYPKNPYINETYYPVELEALTNDGKMRMFRNGQFIRSFYKDFLCADYVPSEMFVRTTDFSRAKTSAQCFLAGLYPPTQEQLWNPMIQWQPIPYTALPLSDEDMLPFYSCPRYFQALNEVLRTPYFQEQWNKYKDVTVELSWYTGLNMTSFIQVYYLNNLLQGQANWGLPAPSWATGKLMKQIREMTNFFFISLHYTEELRKMDSGQLLYKIIEDFKAKIDGKIKPSNRKFFIYSGHETNIAAILTSIGVFQPHQPPYGATIILELRKLLPSQKYVVRVLYIKDVNRPVQVMTIPNCGQLCDINKFIQLTANNVVSDFKPLCPLKSS